MHRINGSTVGDNNSFVDGQTIVNADWLNTIQEEIANVVTASGTQLNDQSQDDKRQLYDSIGKIVAKMTESYLKDYVKNLDYQVKITDLDARITDNKNRLDSIINRNMNKEFI